MFTSEIKESLLKVLESLGIVLKEEEICLEHPADIRNGDYSTNIALVASKLQSFKISKNKKNSETLKLCNSASPRELSDLIKTEWQETGLPDFVQKVEVAGPGFLNIWLSFDALGRQLERVLKQKENFGGNLLMSGKKIMVEYAHPNTHKELHIGHMRTLITGEALARIFSASGASVFRANYQGDIGPHVAKAIWGTEKILAERGMSWEEAEKLSLTQKAHLLGEGYIRGNQDYEKFEKEIDELNIKLYKKNSQVWSIYERTRRWSLDYYDSFYTRFGTKFDRLFFESEVAEPGKKLVGENIPGIFEKSEGAVIFDGEKYGLHKRVFITADGNPTYEGKEMALAYKQYKAFPFDLNVHVVANEQAGYFKVVIKALELLDPVFIGKEFHLSMGMVQLVGKKMSSRTGVILRVDDLLDEVKTLLEPLIQREGLTDQEKENIAEVLTIASVKYSILKVGPAQNVVFDPEKSVNLQGNSGPYLQYSYARTSSVLANSKLKTQNSNLNVKTKNFNNETMEQCSNEEVLLLRTIYKFPEVIEEAAREFSPNLLCNFLFDLCQKFNLFYDKHRIIHNSSFIIQNGDRTKKTSNEDGPSEKQSNFRLLLTAAVGQVIKNGLSLLGIEALEKM